MGQNLHHIWLHLVWSVKNRRPLISQALKPALYRMIVEVADDKGYTVDCLNGAADHIHLLMRVNPKFAVSEIVKNIKGITTTHINLGKLTEDYFEWQDGFGVFSVSPFHINAVRKYIANQEEHHKTTEFGNEMKYLRSLVGE